MNIFRNYSLKPHNSFGLDYKADTFISVSSEEEALAALISEVDFKKPILVLGGGSNLLFVSDFHGTIIYPEIEGIKVEFTDKGSTIISCGSGVNWDTFVEWAVRNGYGGVENLSLIPGKVGATPVQNIGAYGIEIKDIIYKVRAVSLEQGGIREFTAEECLFGYRESIFKGELKNRVLITRVWFKLSTRPEYVTNYGSLKGEIEKLGIPSLTTIRQAVINIRRSKLPDPGLFGNAGSFFKNPVVEKDIADNLNKKYPGLPVYPDPSGGVKISAGWLIEHCGWKGKRHGNAGVFDKQALVIVNYGNSNGKEILELSEMINKSVFEEFGINLQREVEVVGSL